MIQYVHIFQVSRNIAGTNYATVVTPSILTKGCGVVVVLTVAVARNGCSNNNSDTCWEYLCCLCEKPDRFSYILFFLIGLDIYLLKIMSSPRNVFLCNTLFYFSFHAAVLKRISLPYQNFAILLFSLMNVVRFPSGQHRSTFLTQSDTVDYRVR